MEFFANEGKNVEIEVNGKNKVCKTRGKLYRYI